MPKGWFFEIHEDTPEQEAANLMEHSASVLDISSDDDAETKAKNEDLLRGKENIPPPDFALLQPRNQFVNAIDAGEETEIEEPVKRSRRRKITQDAMDEDRKPLGDLPPNEFYGEGCDASSYFTVDVGIERPSKLSKEVSVESTSEDVESETREIAEAAPAVEKAVLAGTDSEESASEAAPTLPEEEAITASEPTSQAVEAPSEEL
jgi:hypothetical protein